MFRAPKACAGDQTGLLRLSRPMYLIEDIDESQSIVVLQ